MKKHTFKTVLIVCLAFLLFAGPAVAQGEAKKKPQRTPDPMMRLIPKDALFCVRVNNLQKTLGSVDQFARGVIPLPMNLGAFLEGDEWNNVVKDGNFALFGLVLDGEAREDNPLANIFVGLLVPVTNYNKVLDGIDEISEPDDNGISNINGGSEGLVTRAGKYALLCWDNDYAKLVKAKKLVTAKTTGIRAAIGTEYKQAVEKPVWAYVNVQAARQTFTPFVSAQIEEMKNQFKKMTPEQRGPMQDMSGIIDMYGTLLDVISDEIQYYSVGLELGEDALIVTETAVAREGTEIAESFAAPPKVEGRTKILNYLEDGAIMNMAMRANSPFLSKTYVRATDLMSFFGSVSSEQLGVMKKVMADTFASLGDYLAFSFNIDDESTFAFKYVVQISDKAKFAKAVEEEIKMMKSGLIDDIYKNFGMKISVNVKQGSTKYKGVSIDSARLAFSATEAGSEMDEVIEAMYGEGFDYRWAVVDDLAVYVVGSDVDAKIRKMIDQVKAGGPKKMADEIKVARKQLGLRGTGDFVGTFNVVRMIKMVASMMSKMPGAPEIGTIPIDSKSNIAFTGSFRNGRMRSKSVLPKQHIQEVIGAGMTMQMKIAQLEAAEASKRAWRPLFNGKDLDGWAPLGNAKWTVEDGQLVGMQGENNAPGDLLTEKSFDDFELSCTYRAEWPCNTGIWFRYQANNKTYQADILEYKNPVCYSGSLYCPGKMFIAMNEDKSIVDRLGWNTIKVHAKGDHLQIWINGHKTADVHDDLTGSGKIGFQVHAGDQFGKMKVVVKEMKIRKI